MLTNQELIDKLKECQEMGKAHVEAMKELVRLSQSIRAELRVRMSGLEVEVKLAEKYRENSENPLLNQLLDLH